jgi:signal transduction histidine kinase
LGLALSKAFVELHGSNLTIESAPGQGTRVSFSLALAEVRPQDAAAAPEA